MAPLNEALADTTMDDAMEEAGVKTVLKILVVLHISIFLHRDKAQTGHCLRWDVSLQGNNTMYLHLSLTLKIYLKYLVSDSKSAKLKMALVVPT